MKAVSSTPYHTLSVLIRGLDCHHAGGPPDQRIAALHYDSRQVEAESLFFALPGIHTDGLHFTEEAVQQGAVAIIAESAPEVMQKGVSYFTTTNARQLLSTLSARFWNHPSATLPVIGITGTDGKSTTIHFTSLLLDRVHIAHAFLTTIGKKIITQYRENPHHQTTPEAPQIHSFLAEALNAHARVALLESTSHGLSKKTHRLSSVHYYGGLITNIHHEHLEFHGNFQQYAQDKQRLLDLVDDQHSLSLDTPPFAILNLNDPLLASLDPHVPTYGYCTTLPDDRSSPILSGHILSDTLQTMEVRFIWKKDFIDVHIPVPGPYNLDNILASLLLTAVISGKDPLLVAEHSSQLTLPKGRMQQVGDSPCSIVDFAHTPQAFSSLLPFVKKHSKGRLIVTFGSAGERDMIKRPALGKIASQHADILILSDEDPRGEPSQKILHEIAEGARNARPDIKEGEELIIISNRRRAIEAAFDLAEKHDTLLFLGKGHEQNILYDEAIPWDEVQVIKDIRKEV